MLHGVAFACLELSVYTQFIVTVAPLLNEQVVLLTQQLENFLQSSSLETRAEPGFELIHALL
jgi:hypothetical protein